MWLFNRKNKRKDDFEMEETFYSESVEVDSDSDEEAYHQIADIITGHSERIRQLLESYFDNPDLLIEELREDDVDWNDEFADLLEQAQDDYWLLMLLTLEKESYATRIADLLCRVFCIRVFRVCFCKITTSGNRIRYD